MSTETHGITRAALEIGYDNGAINRYCTEDQYLHNVYMVVKAMYLTNKKLFKIDRYLSHLSQEDLNTICCGEQSDVERIIATAPDGTDSFLDDIFTLA